MIRSRDSLVPRCLQDNIITADDSTRLTSSGSRSRATDVSQAFEKFTSFVRSLDSSSHFAVIGYIENDGRSYHMTFGKELLGVNITQIFDHFGKSPGSIISKDWESIVMNIADNIPLEEQLSIIGVVPGQYVCSHKDSQNLPLRRAWYLLSPKSTLLQSACTPAQAYAAFQRTSGSFRKRIIQKNTSKRKRPCDSQELLNRRLNRVTSISRLRNLAHMLSGDDISGPIHEIRSVLSPVQQFQLKMMLHGGLIRLLHSSDDMCEVLWNKYDGATGQPQGRAKTQPRFSDFFFPVLELSIHSL